jgi:hypothetical protein
MDPSQPVIYNISSIFKLNVISKCSDEPVMAHMVFNLTFKFIEKVRAYAKHAKIQISADFSLH